MANRPLNDDEVLSEMNKMVRVRTACCHRTDHSPVQRRHLLPIPNGLTYLLLCVWL